MIRRLLRIVLLLAVLVLGAGVAGWAWLWHSESGANWAWNYAVQAVAETENSGELEARVQGTLGRGLRLSNIRYQDADVTVTARRADLAGGIAFSPFAVTVSSARIEGVEVHLLPGPTPQSAPGEGVDLRLPFPIAVRKLQADAVAVISEGQAFTIDHAAGHGVWHRDFSFSFDQVQAHGGRGELEIEAGLLFPFAFESRFDVHEYTTPPDLLESLPWVAPSLSASGTINGDVEAISLDSAIAWPEWLPSARINGQVTNPARALMWRLEFETGRAIIPGNWVEQELGNSLGAPLDRFELQGMSLSAEGDTQRYEFNGSTALASSWLDAQALGFSGYGSVDELEQWSVSGDAEIKAPGWPAGVTSLAATGTSERLEAALHAPELFGGQLQADFVSLATQPSPWDMTLHAQGVAPTPLLEVLTPHLDRETLDQARSVVDTLETESLDFDIRASGQLDPSEVNGEIENLTARGGGRTLHVQGGFGLDDEGFAARQLAISSGASRILVDGQPGVAPGVAMQFNIAELNDLLPDFHGTVNGHANALLGPAGVSKLSVDLEGRNVASQGWTFTTVSAQAEGNFENHRFTLNGDIENAELSAALAGGFDDAGNWQGRLESLSLAPQSGSPWSLQEPAGLRFGDRLELESACVSPRGGSLLCLTLTQSEAGNLDGALELRSFSPNVATDLAGWPWEFTQRLDGTIHWILVPGEPFSANADIQISGGVIIDREEQLELLDTEAGVLRFTVESGNLNAGHLDIPFESGLVDVDFSVPEIIEGADSPISGRIRVDVQDLQAISGFVPGLTQTTGQLNVNVGLSGTAASPHLEGDISLRNGSFQVVSLGTRLREIELDGKLNSKDQIRLEGRFLAGEGSGEIRADLDLADPLRPQIDVSLKGDGLTLVDVPDIRLAADPDIEARWNGESLNLSGQVHVPRALFAPSYVPSDTASESPDVIIVSGGVETEKPETRPIRIFGALELSMGDDVVVDLDLARADLSGRAEFRWSGDVMPMANGQFDMHGEIQAYGQQLEITRATIRFPNVPANNPNLDVRAERRIYGNSLITRAGVFVNGTLKRPQTEPYTVPPTNADRARALLITGSDFDYEQGVGAVNVGTYIAPKLFLSYGVGLFEEGNVITARYELKENLGVKATSGQDETGLDISYTIER